MSSWMQEPCHALRTAFHNILLCRQFFFKKIFFLFSLLRCSLDLDDRAGLREMSYLVQSTQSLAFNTWTSFLVTALTSPHQIYSIWDQGWDQPKYMCININIKRQFSKNNNCRFYPSASEFLSHGFLTRIIVLGMKFSPLEQTSPLIRKLLTTL